jgi:hypothetical protein
MGFFDDDKKLEIAACAIVILLGVYIGGFVMLRASNTNPCEEMDAPMNWSIFREDRLVGSTCP